MNFIAATVELRSIIPDPINAYGLDYRGADVVIPSGNSSGEVKLRALCYNKAGAKLDAFLDWKTKSRALITGYVVFTPDTKEPLDLIVTTIEFNIPQEMYCNQVVLGNAFFGSDEIKERKMTQSQSKSEPHSTTQTSQPGSSWNFINHESLNSVKESVRDGVFASMVTCVSTAKTAMRVLTVQSLRTTSALARKQAEMERVAQQVKQKGMRKWIQSLTTDTPD